MILGWSWANTSHPQFSSTACGPVAVMMAQNTTDRAQELYSAQVTLARQLSSFLPAARGGGSDLDHALAWTAQHGDTLAERLEKLRHNAQISIEMIEDRAPIPHADPGATWLKRRAATLRARQAAQTTALETLRQALAPLQPCQERTRSRMKGFALDLLVARSGIDAALRVVEAQLRQAGAETLRGWSCTLVGPLPVYSFADLP